MEQQEKYMKEALKQAKKAAKLDEVPIGCVITYQDKIIARGYNRRNTDKSTRQMPQISNRQLPLSPDGQDARIRRQPPTDIPGAIPSQTAQRQPPVYSSQKPAP